MGIQGDWGSGKTSLMNIVEEYVEGHGKVISITLNTWQYAQLADEELLPLILLQALHRKAAQDSKKLARMWSGISGAIKRVKGVNVYGFGFQMESDEPAESVDLEDLKKQFADEVRHRLESNKKDRIVIFVDDLDRVLPARAVEILEVLKNFVDVEGCVYVIACDYEVVVKGLKEKFHVGEQDLGGRSFFDKIIQVPFRMPVLQYQVKEYVQGILQRIGWDVPMKHVEDYRALLENSVGFNPRSVKRLCNNLLLLKNVAEGGAEGASSDMLDDLRRQKILFGLVCLEFSYEPVYRALHLAGDDGDLTAMLLNPAETLSNDDLELDYDDKELDAVRGKLEAFLQVLGAVVDENSDGKISAAEQASLQEMMKLSSITSVTSESRAKRKKQSSTRQELMEMAQKSGYLARFESLRGRLKQLTRKRKELRERKSVNFFGYSMDARLAGAEKQAWWTVVRVYARCKHDGLQVSVFFNRIFEANPGDEHMDTRRQLLEFMESSGEYRDTESSTWQHYNVILESDEAAEELWSLLSSLEPFKTSSE